MTEPKKSKFKFSKHKKLLFKYHQFCEKKKEEPILTVNNLIDLKSSDEDSDDDNGPPMPNFPPPPPPSSVQYETESSKALNDLLMLPVTVKPPIPKKPNLIRSQSALMVISTANSETPKIFTDSVVDYRRSIEIPQTLNPANHQEEQLKSTDELAEILRKELKKFQVKSHVDIDLETESEWSDSESD